MKRIVVRHKRYEYLGLMLNTIVSNLLLCIWWRYRHFHSESIFGSRLSVPEGTSHKIRYGENVVFRAPDCHKHLFPWIYFLFIVQISSKLLAVRSPQVTIIPGRHPQQWEPPTNQRAMRQLANQKHPELLRWKYTVTRPFRSLRWLQSLG